MRGEVEVAGEIAEISRKEMCIPHLWGVCRRNDELIQIGEENPSKSADCAIQTVIHHDRLPAVVELRDIRQRYIHA